MYNLSIRAKIVAFEDYLKSKDDARRFYEKVFCRVLKSVLYVRRSDTYSLRWQ